MSGMLRNPKPVALFWSTGKDSALALHELRKNTNYKIVLLVLTVQRSTKRVSMHGVPTNLAIEQAKATGIPFYLMDVPDSSTHTEYENEIQKLKKYLQLHNIRHVAFGDIFLEDLRKYREKLFCSDGFELVFPLWKKDTRLLLKQFINTGFKAILVCCNAEFFPKKFCGTQVDENFIEQLPLNVDPCGENGEFHTFCFDGPEFRFPVRFILHKVVERNYSLMNGKEMLFYFSDIRLPDT